MNDRRDRHTLKVTIRDEKGNVIEETEATALRLLLARAHEEGFTGMKAEILQFPGDTNRWSAIVRATVRLHRGSFAGIGEATPENVNPLVALHVVASAETRALVRALRWGLGIANVAIEELAGRAKEAAGDNASGSHQNGNGHAPRSGGFARPQGSGTPHPAPERSRGRDSHPTESLPNDRRAMSDEQKKLLFRLAYDLGFEKDAAREKVLSAVGVERLEWATKPQASAGIDALRNELREQDGRQNGHGNGTTGAHHA
jgi:hypothetical protein